MIQANVDRVIAVARGEIGQREQPMGSNRTKYGAWYGLQGPWCAIFISWVFDHAGYRLPPISTSKGFAYVQAGKEWAQRNGSYQRGTAGIKAGDIILFSFSSSRVNHTGLVLGRLNDGRIHTLEGNTDVSGGRTGGIVMEKYRSSGIDGYIRVNPLNTGVDWPALRRYLAGLTRAAYGATPNMGGDHPNHEQVKSLQQALNLVTGANLTIDGVYGNATILAVVNYQTWMNKLGCGIKDFPGASAEGTRFWLCTALDSIVAGKA